MTSGGAWAICDRCSFRERHANCRTEWTGAFVCQHCYDPRPVWLDPPVISPLEGMPVTNARPDPAPRFISDDEPVTEDDL